jgi:hypothetical protein
MKISHHWLVSVIARVLIVTLMSSIAYAAPQAQGNQENGPPETDKVPDSPGAVQTQPQGNSNQQLSGQKELVSGDSPSLNSANRQSLTAQNEAQPANSAAASQEPHQPLGTAAAESIPTMGIAASQPAGAAVAPAKQRRVRTILIRVGAVVAGAAAVGVVVALSEGSPSRPPGAH